MSSDILKPRALFSVYDKSGIEKFASFLNQKNYEIVSTGGTFRYLKENSIPAAEVSDITGFPEVLGGRVKTLHPFIHAGILMNRAIPEHVGQMKSHEIAPVDFVVVNLYPFEETVNKSDAEFSEIIEQIDIGGVALLRAAAKNHKDVTVIVDPADFDSVSDEIEKNGSVSTDTRVYLASKAFSHTAYYDSIISKYFNQLSGIDFPKEYSVPMKLKEILRYGENPHQKAALYQCGNQNSVDILNADILWGKALSYNNMMDADAALDILRDFDQSKSFCAILKHTNPCGAAYGEDLLDAYEKALSGDPVSAFGGIVITNRKMNRTTAKKINERFFEIIIAPDYDEDSLNILKKKKNLRIIRLKGEDYSKKDKMYRRVENGFLVQDWDVSDESKIRDEQIVTEKKPSQDELESMVFAWKICKHIKSNAIVYVKDNQVIGIGAGQMSRIDSAKFGALKANEYGFDLNGSVLASDAFFPFRDSVDTAAEEGVTSIIQPGGSIRDKDSIQSADEHGITMVFTGSRHFKH